MVSCYRHIHAKKRLLAELVLLSLYRLYMWPRLTVHASLFGPLCIHSRHRRWSAAAKYLYEVCFSAARLFILVSVSDACINSRLLRVLRKWRHGIPDDVILIGEALTPAVAVTRKLEPTRTCCLWLTIPGVSNVSAETHFQIDFTTLSIEIVANRPIWPMAPLCDHMPSNSPGGSTLCMAPLV